MKREGWWWFRWRSSGSDWQIVRVAPYGVDMMGTNGFWRVETCEAEGEFGKRIPAPAGARKDGGA